MAEAGKAYSQDENAKAKWLPATDTISAEIRTAAAQIITDSRLPSSNLGALLNVFLNKYLPWPYRATPGKASDATGAESPEFESLIHTSPQAIKRIATDNLACAIDVHEKLGLEQLRQSYEKIAHVKALAKSIVPTVSQGVPVADATMGIIFAVDLDAPIESLAEELARLNREHSYRVWPDMVVVLSRGTVNLMCQIPYKPLGDFLPPAREMSHRPAMYIHVFARAHAAFALNKLCAVLFPYLYFFQPGVGFLLPYKEILKDMPATRDAHRGFPIQPKGRFGPVSTSARFEELFLFPLSFEWRIRGNLLAKAQYLPWQDEALCGSKGSFPSKLYWFLPGRAPSVSQSSALGGANFRRDSDVAGPI